MTHHDLKCAPEYFDLTWLRHKTDEIRYNDRDYQLGDTVTLYRGEYFCNPQAPKIHATIRSVVSLEKVFGRDAGYKWVLLGLGISKCEEGAEYFVPFARKEQQ
jgi:hypothetical protein